MVNSISLPLNTQKWEFSVVALFKVEKIGSFTNIYCPVPQVLRILSAYVMRCPLNV
jgi:hypothetical protein